jgi:hypothetical protein
MSGRYFHYWSKETKEHCGVCRKDFGVEKANEKYAVFQEIPVPDYPEKNRGPWSRVSTTGGIHLLDPSEDEIFIEDIANSLAKQCRYNGNIQEHYSVAEHSVILSHMVEEHQLEALMHDAAEAYISDIARPVQEALGYDACEKYKAIEAGLLHAIGKKYGLRTPIPISVLAMDDRLMREEMTEMDSEEFDTIEFWSADLAEYRFLERFWELKEGRK